MGDVVVGEGAVKHRPEHTLVERQVQAVMEEYRSKIGLEAVWSIEVRVECPEDLPNYEASIWWDVEFFYARLSIRCQLSRVLQRWLVLHELCELQMWRSANSMFDLLNRLWPPGRVEKNPRLRIEREVARKEWMALRNQEIECRLFGLLGEGRPGHMMM